MSLVDKSLSFFVCQTRIKESDNKHLGNVENKRGKSQNEKRQNLANKQKQAKISSEQFIKARLQYLQRPRLSPFWNVRMT